MSVKYRKDGSLFLANMVDGYAAFIDTRLSTEVHRDKTAAETGTTLLPTSTPLVIDAIATQDLDGYMTAVNQIKHYLKLHIDDDSAHLIADTTNDNFDGYAEATTLSTAELLANAIKIDYNAHRSQSGVHLNNDSGHQTTSNVATSLSTLGTLVGEERTDINAHLADAGATPRPKLVPA